MPQTAGARYALKVLTTSNMIALLMSVQFGLMSLQLLICGNICHKYLKT